MMSIVDNGRALPFRFYHGIFHGQSRWIFSKLLIFMVIFSLFMIEWDDRIAFSEFCRELN